MRLVLHSVKSAAVWFVVLIGLCAVLFTVRLFFMGGQQPYPSQQLAMRGSAAQVQEPGSTAQANATNPQCNVGFGAISVDLCAHFAAVISSTMLDPVTNGALQVTKGNPTISGTNPLDTYLNPDIGGLHSLILVAADSFLLLAILITGIRMVWMGTAHTWADFRETLPQVLIAFLLSQLSLVLCGELIELNNALINVILPTGVLALNNLIPPASADLFTDFLRFVLGIFIILLYLEAAVRIPVINLGIVLSGAGCFALAWKPTQKLGHFWLNTFVSSIFIQFLQVLCLVIGLVLFKSLTQQANDLVTTLGGISIAFVALSLPFYVYRWAIQPSYNVVRAGIQAGQEAVDETVGAVKTAAMLAAGA